jgi:serine protease Do
MDGEVVGVNSAIYSPTGGSVGVGFAVASNIVDQIVEDLKDDGRVDRGWLGVSIQDVTSDLAAALSLDQPTGALVSSVVDGSPSDGALRSGDVILEFDGAQVASSRDLPRLVAATEADAQVDVVVLRNGDTEVVQVKVGQFKTERTAERTSPSPKEDTTLEALGATVAELTDSTRAQIGMADGIDGLVVTSVSASGPAAKAGLQVGDVIVRMGNEDIPTTKALSEALASKKTEPALLLIHRAGQQIFVAVKIA